MKNERVPVSVAHCVDVEGNHCALLSCQGAFVLDLLAACVASSEMVELAY